MTPQVSICIPAYGQPEYLRRTLESILCQTYRDYEIVITDDSPDSLIQELVSEFKDRAKFKYRRNSSRKGSPANWNEAVRLAQGRYIKLLHHDDWFADSNSLTDFVDMLDQAPQADLAFCSSLAYCSSLEEHGLRQKLRFVHAPSARQLRQLSTDPGVLFSRNFIGAPSATIYRGTVNERFDTQLKWHVDVDFYIRVLRRNGSFVFCERPLICITSESIDHHTVTSECVGNRSVEVSERLYLYNKMSRCGRLNFKRIGVMWSLFRRHGIWSRQDVVDCGFRFDIPLELLGLLFLRRFLAGILGLLSRSFGYGKRIFTGCSRRF